ncbi:two-component regulator propeller domain-containing protein [Hugenholtzia roseola]|uniref:two-component regulator propeller domain-containing protein n=1 Tax=Hugenholtzia roseola TaxID=1002 RepID=UPI00047D0B76|nr:two-component regulator propeller domain-containing protein [Hugenholtzia roseola]
MLVFLQKKLPFGAFFFLVLFFPKLKAQTATSLYLDPEKKLTQFIWQQWQKEDGLPQNSVQALLQTQDGYLWVGTLNGFAKFNGVTFETFNTATHKGLLQNHITAFCEQNQDLWIGTTAGLVRYRGGYFRTFTTQDQLLNQSIHDLLHFQNQLWIATEGGLFKYTRQVFRGYNQNHGLPLAPITALYAHQNRFWVGTKEGLFLYDAENDTFSKIESLATFSIRALAQKGEQLWIGTKEGLFLLDLSQNEPQTLEKIVPYAISTLYLDARGSLWIGTENQGVGRRVEPKEAHKSNPSKSDPNKTATIDWLSVKDGFPSNTILKIWQDREGSLWIATERGGLIQLFEGKFTLFSETEGLADKLTNCIFEHQDSASSEKEIWVGTNNGLSLLKKDTLYNYSTKEGLGGTHIRSITADKAGTIWVGTLGGGIAKFDRKNNRFQSYHIHNGLVNDAVRALAPALDGGLWIGTIEGISYFKEGKFENISIQNTFITNAITFLHQSPTGLLYIGTEEGLAVLDSKQNGRSYLLTTQDGLPNNFILSLYEEYDAQKQNSTLWIGTKAGLAILDEKGLRQIRQAHKHYEKGHKDQDFLGDAIHSLNIDIENKVWITSNDGIFAIQKSELLEWFENEGAKKSLQTVWHFDEQDGLRSSETASLSQPAAFIDSQNRLWVATSEGVAVLPTQAPKIRRNRLTPLLQILRIETSERQELSPPAGEAVVFHGGNNQYVFHFEALSFLSVGNIRFRYQLKGYDSQPRQTAERSVSYPKLPPGNYVFWVTAANADGTWHEKGIEIPIQVEPLLQQRVIFWVFIAVLVLLVIYSITKWRISLANKKAEQLELRVENALQEGLSQSHQIREQAEELEIINRIVARINTESRFEGVLQVLLSEGVTLFDNCDRAYFLLYSDQDYTFELAALHGYSQENIQGALFSFKTITSYFKNSLEVGTHFYKQYTVEGIPYFIQNYRPCFSLVLPIKLQNKLSALLVLDFDKNKKFETREIKQLERFTEQAVSAFIRALSIEEMAAQNQALERSIEQLSDSIKYAQRIQNSLLKKVSDIAPHFQDFFLFYKPKDVVSGDFYWFYPLPKRVILAAVDCTGHGVPGAFMTVMGISILNQIVKEREITSPSELLYALDAQIAAAFRNSNPNEEQKDGMDMSVVIIDSERQEIAFSGAKNPLYYTHDGEMQVVKGSKFPIGSAGHYKNKVFEDTIFKYEKNDTFYLFTDGFQDQFGGEQGRKFMSQKFREFLLEYSYLPLPEQLEKLESAFKLWKGNHKQTDDNLIIGFKIK